MKRALNFTKKVLRAYLKNSAEMYKPMIDAGVTIII